MEKPKLKICKVSTTNNIVREMRELKPYVETHPDMATKFANLWDLYRQLDLTDCGIKQIAHKLDLIDYIGWKSA